MTIKPRNDDPECCAALGRIAQTPDGPNWAEADPADALLAEKLIRYYWRFALNVAGQELKRQGTNTLPRSQKNRVQQYREEYCDDESGDDVRPDDEDEPDGVGQYLDDFASDVPQLIHKAAAAFNPARGKFPGFLATVISNVARDWTKRRTIPGMNGRAAEAQPELSIAETLESVELGALYEAADAEVMDRVRVLTRRHDRVGAAVLRNVWAGQSGAHIARRLGITEGAVSQRVAVFRERLPHFDEAMALHRIAVKYVNNDGRLSPSDLSFLADVRIRYRGSNSASLHLNEGVNTLVPNGRPVKTFRKIIYPRWATTPEAPSHHGRTEVLFDPGQGEPLRIGDRHLFNVTVHHQPRLINTDTDSEAEYRARTEYFEPALPTPWKHGDGKCRMVQHKSEDHRPTRRIFNELAQFLEERGEDWQVFEKWKRYSETSDANRRAATRPPYRFAWSEHQTFWSHPVPGWGSESEEDREARRYERIRRGATICSPKRRWINTADRSQLASEHARKQKLARLDIAVRRGKVWRAPKLEPVWAPELVRYDFVPPPKIVAPPLQPSEFVDPGSTCACNVTTATSMKEAT